MPIDEVNWPPTPDSDENVDALTNLYWSIFHEDVSERMTEAGAAIINSTDLDLHTQIAAIKEWLCAWTDGAKDLATAGYDTLMDGVQAMLDELADKRLAAGEQIDGCTEFLEERWMETVPHPRIIATISKDHIARLQEFIARAKTGVARIVLDLHGRARLDQFNAAVDSVRQSMCRPHHIFQFVESGQNELSSNEQRCLWDGVTDALETLLHELDRVTPQTQCPRSTLRVSDMVQQLTELNDSTKQSSAPMEAKVPIRQDFIDYWNYLERANSDLANSYWGSVEALGSSESFDPNVLIEHLRNAFHIWIKVAAFIHWSGRSVEDRATVLGLNHLRIGATLLTHVQSLFGYAAYQHGRERSRQLADVLNAAFTQIGHCDDSFIQEQSGKSQLSDEEWDQLWLVAEKQIRNVATDVAQLASVAPKGDADTPPSDTDEEICFWRDAMLDFDADLAHAFVMASEELDGTADALQPERRAAVLAKGLTLWCRLTECFAYKAEGMDQRTRLGRSQVSALFMWLKRVDVIHGLIESKGGEAARRRFEDARARFVGEIEVVAGQLHRERQGQTKWSSKEWGEMWSDLISSVEFITAEIAAVAPQPPREIWHFAKWYDVHTDGALYADHLRVTARRNLIRTRKSGGRREYELESVIRRYPQHEKSLLDAHRKRNQSEQA